MRKETLFGNIETDEDRNVECSTGNYDCDNCSLKSYNRDCRNQNIYDTQIDRQELHDIAWDGFFTSDIREPIPEFGSDFVPEPGSRVDLYEKGLLK